jgi:2,3-bisphosphoglycerate-independent phosphoglycerate mutase
METRKVSDTGDPGKDLQERLAIACEAKAFDFVHVHTKVADEAAHTKNPLLKKQVIESVDAAIAYAIEKIVPDDDILFVVTADHSTASTGRMIHTGETVPMVMLGKHVRRDAVESFDEVSCASGGLSLVRGKELMYLVLNFLDRGKLWGLMDSPDDQPFTPGRAIPLEID